MGDQITKRETTLQQGLTRAEARAKRCRYPRTNHEMSLARESRAHSRRYESPSNALHRPVDTSARNNYQGVHNQEYHRAFLERG